MELLKPLCLWEVEIAGLPTLRIEARSASQAKSIAADTAQTDHKMTRTEVLLKMAACRNIGVLNTTVPA